MSTFIFPSDFERSENEDLDRVCGYLEDVLGLNEALYAHIQFLHKELQEAAVIIDENTNLHPLAGTMRYAIEKGQHLNKV